MACSDKPVTMKVHLGVDCTSFLADHNTGPVGYPESTLYTYKRTHSIRVIDITYGMLDKCKTADGGNMF